MATNGQTIRTITIRGTSEGLDKLTADLRGLATAEKDVAVVSDDLTKRQISLAAAWKATGLRLDETARAQDTFTRLSKQNTQALAQEQITVQQHAERLALLNERYGQASASATKLTAGMTAAGDVGAVASQRMVAGLSAVGKEADMAAKAMDRLAASAKPTADQLASSKLTAGLTAAGDVGAVASQKMVSGMTAASKAAAEASTATTKSFSQMITGMSAAGDTGAVASHKMITGMSAMGKEVAAVAPQVDKVTISQAALTKQSSRNAAEMLNLGRQFADVGVSLQAGQSLLTVGIQQGAQIIDVFASSGRTAGQIFGQAVGWAGRFVASTAGVVTGIAGIAAGALGLASAWQTAQREIDVALLGVGRRSGVTAKDINEIARTSATTFGLSVDQARSAALEFVKTGAIYRDNIKAAVDVTYDFSIVTGKNAKDAAKDLASALANPAAGADALNKQIGFLDGRTREYIETLVSQNRSQEAQAVLLRNLAPAIQGATNTLGPFEKAWDAVANAAIRAKNAVGAALTPDTNEQRRDALVTAINRSTTPLLEGTPVDTRSLDKSKVAAMRLEVEALNEQLRESARAYALSGGAAKQWSIDADDAVKTLIPEIEQLKQLTKLRADLARTSDPSVSGRQGLGQFNDPAANALAVREANTKSAMEMDARRNAINLELLQTYNTQNIAIARQLDAQKDQLAVAAAFGGQARMAAQEQATYNALRRDGVSAEDAATFAAKERAVSQEQLNTQVKEQTFSLQNQLPIHQAITGAKQISAQYEATINQLTHDGVGYTQAAAQAEAQRANSLAQVNAEADRTLVNLQQEGELIRANTAWERDRIKAGQTYRNLIDKGVDSAKAAAVAAQQLSNDRQRSGEETVTTMQRVQQATGQTTLNVNSAADAWNAYRQGIISWSVANEVAGQAARQLTQTIGGLTDAMVANNNALLENSKFVPFATTWASMGPTGLGTGGGPQGSQGLTQFDPKGYTSQLPQTQQAIFTAATRYGEGGYDRDMSKTTPFTSQFLALVPNAQGLEKVVNDAMAGGVTNAISGIISGLSSANAGLMQSTAGVLSRLTNVLPDDQKAGAIQQQLDVLKGAPASLARDELIKQLNDQLKQLTDATNQNTSATSAMTDVLSPFYSQDPRSTHLGFRAFAGGGIMSQYGELPIMHYQGGGMATSPQVAVFGEGSMPEAYVPVPSGRIPVEIKTPANSNKQRPVNVTINVMGNADSGTVQALKSTAFQQAQAMRRMMG